MTNLDIRRAIHISLACGLAVFITLAGFKVLAGHETGAEPNVFVNTGCADRDAALVLGMSSGVDHGPLLRGYVNEGRCFYLGRDNQGSIRISVWADEITGCGIDGDGVPHCVLKVHDRGGEIAYSYLVGTRAEIKKGLGWSFIDPSGYTPA